MNATIKHSDWNKEYKEKLSVPLEQIPTLFIDPVFPVFSKEPNKIKKVARQPEALEKFNYYTRDIMLIFVPPSQGHEEFWEIFKIIF